MATLLSNKAFVQAIRYCIAIVLVAIAISFSLFIAPHSPVPVPPFAPYFIAVLLTAIFVGSREGILATVLSLLGACYWLFAPSGSFRIQQPLDGVRAVFFTVLSVLVCVVLRYYRQTLQKAAAYDREERHREAQEAIRQSNERYEFIAQATNDALWDWNPETYEIWWGSGITAFFGWPREHSMSHCDWKAMHTHPEEASRVRESLLAAIAGTDTEWKCEYRFRHHDGSYRFIYDRALLIRNREGKVTRIVGAMSDVTEQKQIFEQLRVSEARWATTLQSIGDAVISTDLSGRIEFMNAFAEKLTGWTLEEAKGRELSQVFHIVEEGSLQPIESPAEKVIRLGTVVGLTEHMLLIRRDGQQIPLEDSAAPIRDQNHVITGVVIVFHDTIAKRRSEKLLRDSDRLAITGRLAATLAHEIHNPLDSIANLLFLMRTTADQGTIQQYVTMASSELERVTQMTRTMLAFQREATKPVPMRIEDVLESVIELYGRKLESSNIQVKRKFQANIEFAGLPGELRQVFANLVGNAIEALEKNGRIRLHTILSQDRQSGRKGFRVFIADDGPGIPAHIRSIIFEPFFTTKGESGTGLGLWITAGIVKKYDGNIRLRSSTNPQCSGTCFSIFIPTDHKTSSDDSGGGFSLEREAAEA